eukprot:5922034-Pleurochrysis_carterae.AAC.1
MARVGGGARVAIAGEGGGRAARALAFERVKVVGRLRHPAVNELAIACAYVLVILQYETKPSGGPDGAHSTPQSSSTSRSPELAVLKPLVDAYTQLLPLKEEEWTVLPTLIACRLAMSLAIGNFSAAK